MMIALREFQSASSRALADSGSPEALRLREKATDRMNEEDAWDVEALAKKILQALLPDVPV